MSDLLFQYDFSTSTITNNVTTINNIAPTGNIYNATAINGPIIGSPGVTSNTTSVLFDSTKQQYISIPNFTTGNNGLTFTFWFKSINNSGYGTSIFDFSNGAGNNNIFVIFDNGSLRFSIYGNSGVGGTSLDNVVPNVNNNTWIHIAWTLLRSPSNTWKIYVNGILKITESKNYPNSVQRTQNYLARNSWPYPYFSGNIADFRFYNSALTDTQILYIYNPYFLAIANEKDRKYLDNQDTINEAINPANNKSMQQVITAINENLAQLTLVQNQLNKENNIDQEILIKKQQLLKFKNDDLSKQLQELEIIESNISNKDKIIQQINYNIERQNMNINNLIISIVLAIILCVAVGLYAFGKIDNTKFILFVVIIIICYISLFLYTYNIFYIKDAISYLFNARSIQSLGNKLITWEDTIEKDSKKRLDDLEQSWIENNCVCPNPSDGDDGGQNDGSSDSYISIENKIIPEHAGYFYYDQSAPPQLIVPEPVPTIDKNKIDWVDYSSNGNVLYNLNSNKISYDNTHYYQYKNTEDPAIKLKKNINDFNLNEVNAKKSFVNNTTYSTNF